MGFFYTFTFMDLHNFINLVNQWKVKYHTQKNDIVFQNKTTMTNVRFTNKSMSSIKIHARGAEQLPETIMNPDEVYSRWKDVKTQRTVLRSYIAGSYVVLTQDGVITDAFLVKSKDKYRVGCLVVV